jgi:hypothetical protein
MSYLKLRAALFVLAVGDAIVFPPTAASHAAGMTRSVQMYLIALNT